MKRFALSMASVGIAFAGYGWAYWMIFDDYNSTVNLIERDKDVGLAIGSIGVDILVLAGTTAAVFEIMKEAWKK